MKRSSQLLVAAVLLGSLTIQAEPFKDWTWMDPTEYENNTPIPAGDLVARTLHCSNSPADTTIPDGSKAFGNIGSCADRYETSTIFISQTPPSREDMAFIVGGLPGTYYCAATVGSIRYQSRAGCSEELNFIVLPGALGFVPKPMTLSLQ